MSNVDNMIDLPWRNFLSPEFQTKFQKEFMPLFLEVLKFPYNSVGSLPAKNHPIHLAISIQYQLLMDRQTDGHTMTAYTALA